MEDIVNGTVAGLSDEELRTVNGGVTEGGCIDPVMKRIIDALTGTVPPV